MKGNLAEQIPLPYSHVMMWRSANLTNSLIKNVAHRRFTTPGVSCMVTEQEKQETILALMSALGRQKFMFAADQFTDAYVNRFLDKIPPSVRTALDFINRSEDSWTGTLTLQSAIEIAKKATNISVIPIGEVAGLFRRHKVDPGLVNQVFGALSGVSVFSCIRYTYGTPELVTCVDADKATVSDAIHLANGVHKINTEILYKTGRKTSALRNAVSWAHICFTFFTPDNTDIIPAITSECKRYKVFGKSYTLPFCLDVSNRQMSHYPGFPNAKGTILGKASFVSEVFA